jgi:hypothetical protein
MEPDLPHHSPNRRATLAAIALALTGALGLGAWLRNRPAPLTLLPDRLGFLRESSGSLTSTLDPFAGLTLTDDPLLPTEDILRKVEAAPCPVAFGRHHALSKPIAVFTDYYCPICRRFEADLEPFLAGRSDLPPVHWLELPLLGEASVAAARIALAAKRQNAYPDMRGVLMRTRPALSRPQVTSLAERLSLDPVQLWADATGTGVTEELQAVRALAHLLGIPGTPSIVLGGTVVIGALNGAQLDDLARRTPPPPC